VGLREVLGAAGFRRLYVTRVAGQLADGVFQAALASYVFFSPERQASAGAAAAAFAVLLLPYSLVGPFAGVLLDRWRRRHVLVVANLARAGLVVGVAALVGAGRAGVSFYAAALVVLSVNRFVLAGLAAALPHVVASRQLITANAVATTSGTVAAIVGAGLGVLLRGAVGSGSGGTAVVVLAAAGAYAAAGLLALRLGRDQLGPDRLDATATVEGLRRVLNGIIDGAQHVRAHRAAAHALAAIAAHRFCYGVSTVAAILLYRNYFNPPDAADAALGGLAIAFVASGIGFLLAAVLTPWVTRRIRPATWVSVLFAAAAVVQVVLGTPYTEPLLVVAAVLLGIVAQGAKICVDSIVQAAVDDAYRGRVFSFYDVAFNVSFVAAAAFAALALPPTGKSYVVLSVVAAGYALTALLYGRASRRWAAYQRRSSAAAAS
jgi:MFS family permease